MSLTFSFQIQTCFDTAYGWQNYDMEYLRLDEAVAVASQLEIAPHYSVRVVKIEREVAWKDATRL